MKIIINTSVLKTSLQKVMGVVSKDLTMPILSHVLIEKNNKEILVGISTGGLYYLSTCNHPDINNDSFINVIDAILIVNFIIDQSIEDYLECSYDLNNDNVINVIDIIYLINLILN